MLPATPRLEACSSTHFRASLSRKSPSFFSHSLNVVNIFIDKRIWNSIHHGLTWGAAARTQEHQLNPVFLFSANVPTFLSKPKGVPWGANLKMWVQLTEIWVKVWLQLYKLKNLVCLSPVSSLLVSSSAGCLLAVGGQGRAGILSSVDLWAYAGSTTVTAEEHSRWDCLTLLGTCSPSHWFIYQKIWNVFPCILSQGKWNLLP